MINEFLITILAILFVIGCGVIVIGSSVLIIFCIVGLCKEIKNED